MWIKCFQDSFVKFSFLELSEMLSEFPRKQRVSIRHIAGVLQWFQQEGPGFSSWWAGTFLCGLDTFSLCLLGFSSGCSGSLLQSITGGLRLMCRTLTERTDEVLDLLTRC